MCGRIGRIIERFGPVDRSPSSANHKYKGAARWRSERSFVDAESGVRAGLRCWVGTMPELGIASAQALNLAMHSGFSFPTDIEASSRWYVGDIVEPAIAIDRSGFIHVPEGSGTGFKVDREGVERYTTAVERFSL
jgi:hypothetical protein